MLAILLGLFRLIWLFGKGHDAVALENLALRQQLACGSSKCHELVSGVLRLVCQPTDSLFRLMLLQVSVRPGPKRSPAVLL